MRWRLLELNSRLSLARFLAVQVEGKPPVYEKDWRRLEPLAKSSGLYSAEINGIGDRHGEWQDGPLP